MADRIGQFGAVERVEVEVAHAARIEPPAHLGRHRRRDELARGGVIVQPLEQPVHPRRDRRAAHAGELARLRDVRDGQDAGHDLGVDARRRRAVAEAEEGLGREEELA